MLVLIKLTPKILSKVRINSYLKTWIVEYKKKFYVLERTGECDYKKCKSACCKFYHIGCRNFDKAFGEKTKFGMKIVADCVNLNKDGKCKLWGKKAFSNACKQFPHPNDSHYLVAYEYCAFRFKILGEFKPTKEYLNPPKLEERR